MKDIYKQKVGDTIDSIDQRIKIIQQMVSGERQADQRQANVYLKEIRKGLSNIQEMVNIS